MSHHPLGPKEIDGLLVPPGKASLLLTDLLLINQSGLSFPTKNGSSQIIHTYKPYWLSWVVMSPIN